MRARKMGLVRGAVFASTLLGASTAFAAAGVMSATVAPLSETVTYSSLATAKSPALNTFIGYSVLVTNTSGNTINNVTFEGTITVADANEEVSFSSADGATCSAVQPALNVVTISCVMGQFKANGTTTFAVFFKAPVKDTLSPTDPDTVTFAGRIITAEGPVAGNSPNDSVDFWTSAPDVTLGTPNATRVKSAVPKAGGAFFTGTGGVSLAGDPFTTTVSVPTLATFTTATIDETEVPGCGSTNFVTCYASSLTIPGTFSPYLSIIIRQDATQIVKGTKIGSVLIQYTYEYLDPLDNVLKSATVNVGDCASPTTPLGNGLPCIAERKHYKTKNVPGWTPDLDGDFEWKIINTMNGRYDVF